MQVKRSSEALSAIFAALIACTSTLIGAGCTSVEPAAHARHAIWDVTDGHSIDRHTLFARLAAARFVLLGEIHDNLHHHALEAEVLREMVAHGRRPAVAMEMFDLEQQHAIDRAQAASATPEYLAEQARFDFKGWHWPFYRPLVATALDEHLPIVAANLSRAALQDVIKQGFGTLGAGRAERLGLPPSLPREKVESARQGIIEGHCNMLPPAAIDGMLRAQQARDATMAEAIQRHPARGALLVAGAEHIRRDVAVPVYLPRDLRSRDVAVLAFVETPDEGGEALTAERLREFIGRFVGVFDYVWITPRAARDDPCTGFGERLRPAR